MSDNKTMDYGSAALAYCRHTNAYTIIVTTVDEDNHLDVCYYVPANPDWRCQKDAVDLRQHDDVPKTFRMIQGKDDDPNFEFETTTQLRKAILREIQRNPSKKN